MFFWSSPGEGVPLPIQVIHKAAKLTAFLMDGLPGAGLTFVDAAGYQNTGTFMAVAMQLVEHIRRLRADGTRDGRPHFVFLDGHASHMSPEVLAYFIAHNVFPMFLPSHMSSHLQPADTGLNAILKTLLRNAYHALLLRLDVLEMDIPYLNALIAQVWPEFVRRALEGGAAAKAWRAAGLFPLRGPGEVFRTTEQVLAMRASGVFVPFPAAPPAGAPQGGGPPFSRGPPQSADGPPPRRRRGVGRRGGGGVS